MTSLMHHATFMLSTGLTADCATRLDLISSGRAWYATTKLLHDLFICNVRIHRGEGGGAAGADTPLENYKNIGFISNTGPDPLKITNIPIKHSMFGHRRPACETPLNGVSLAGR